MTLHLFIPGADRDDLAQEAAIARLEAERCYDGSSPLESFVALVVRRRLFSAVRDARRGKHLVLTEAVRDLEERLDWDADPAGIVERREELAELARRVRGLAPRQRACLLHVVNGASLTECAEAEGLTWKQAENAVSWARKTLRDAA